MKNLGYLWLMLSGKKVIWKWNAIQLIPFRCQSGLVGASGVKCALKNIVGCLGPRLIKANKHLSLRNLIPFFDHQFSNYAAITMLDLASFAIDDQRAIRDDAAVQRRKCRPCTKAAA